jgi:histone acetyltransferase (RNA polymerase elongator complex component)
MYAMEQICSFEQGPIRPPSEAKSLLIRATRNCPWNRCTFCHTYRNRKFELRKVADIKKDIQVIRDIADRLREISWRYGEGGRVSEAVVNHIYSQDQVYSDGFRSVAAWLYWGADSVFIQDANSIVMKTEDLVEALSFIREKFPSVNRITSYCRSQTAARKTVDDFRMLKSAGLSRIHIGMESGYDPLLQFVNKGVTAAEHIEGGKKILEAGISLCEYVMPGLGGNRWSREHAEETARVINQINPDYVRLRSLHVVEDTGLFEMMKKGDFTPLGDEEIVREIRLFIEHLDGIETTIVSDHILNLLEELEGKLPEDKAKLLGVIDSFFALPLEKRLIYRRRRTGVYRKLNDLLDMNTFSQLKNLLEQYDTKEPDQLEKDISRIMQGYI